MKSQIFKVKIQLKSNILLDSPTKKKISTTLYFNSFLTTNRVAIAGTIS